jgi:hypothetical protein
MTIPSRSQSEIPFYNIVRKRFQAKMVDSLKSRGKILGLAMGQLVVAKLDESPIPAYSFLADLVDLLEKLNKVITLFLKICNYFNCVHFTIYSKEKYMR